MLLRELFINDSQQKWDDHKEMRRSSYEHSMLGEILMLFIAPKKLQNEHKHDYLML